jgi:sugar phosphate isomerase/epimerase
MKIGCMIWRIGDILDFYEQIAWVKAHGFEELSFWTMEGVAGVWQGFDVHHATQSDISKLKGVLDGIDVDIHAGFDERRMSLIAEYSVRKTTIDFLLPTFQLAEKIGAKVITIHTGPRDTELSLDAQNMALADSLEKLNNLAAESGVRVGVETTWDIALIEQLSLRHVGITLDIGHLHFSNGAAFEAYGALGGLIERFGAQIVHVHAHDYDGRSDHLAIGHGYIDFKNIIEALCRVGFSDNICLEINPDRESPEAILESRARLQEIIAVQPESR